LITVGWMVACIGGGFLALQLTDMNHPAIVEKLRQRQSIEERNERRKQNEKLFQNLLPGIRPSENNNSDNKTKDS